MQMTLRDFAKENGVSYEAVRQQVKRYAADLEGHIHHQGRTQYLDDIAISFLNSKRAQNPLVIYDQDRDEELRTLREKVDMLQEKVIAAQDLALASQGALVEAKAARLALDAAEKDKEILEGVIADAKAEIQAVTKEKAEEVAAARLEVEEAKARVEDLQRALDAEKARREALEGMTLLQWLKRRRG